MGEGLGALVPKDGSGTCSRAGNLKLVHRVEHLPDEAALGGAVGFDVSTVDAVHTSPESLDLSIEKRSIESSPGTPAAVGDHEHPSGCVLQGDECIAQPGALGQWGRAGDPGVHVHAGDRHAGCSCPRRHALALCIERERLRRRGRADGGDGNGRVGLAAGHVRGLAGLRPHHGQR